jgi:hypothetical protein
MLRALSAGPAGGGAAGDRRLPPRHAPRRPFPPYAFRPGLPHPRSPGGHSPGAPPPLPRPLDEARWDESEEYLFGIDLFNFGYYWEAHEAWEGLWKAAGKAGATAEFLKGLIKLTAAVWKARIGCPAGAASHGRSAREHFERVRREAGAPRFAGLELDALILLADRSAAGRPGDEFLLIP